MRFSAVLPEIRECQEICPSDGRSHNDSLIYQGLFTAYRIPKDPRIERKIGARGKTGWQKRQNYLLEKSFAVLISTDLRSTLLYINIAHFVIQCQYQKMWRCVEFAISIVTNRQLRTGGPSILSFDGHLPPVEAKACSGLKRKTDGCRTTSVCRKISNINSHPIDRRTNGSWLTQLAKDKTPGCRWRIMHQSCIIHRIAASQTALDKFCVSSFWILH